MVFGDSDGWVHALDPATGAELRGWPVSTDATVVRRSHPGVDPGHEPVLSSVAVGAITGSGRLAVLATSSTGKVYAWTAEGRRLKGWPQQLGAGVTPPAVPRPDLPFTRLPIVGALAPPVLSDLDGRPGLEIVQAGWDGHLHVYSAKGRELRGWPVDVALPPGYTPPAGKLLVEDHKLQTIPTVADLDGDGDLEVVVRSQFTDTEGPGVSLNALGHVFAFHHDGTPVAGWPATISTFAEAYGTAMDALTEGTSSGAAADVDGDGDDEIAISGAFGPTVFLNGDGTVRTTLGTAGSDLAVVFTTSGAFGQLGGTLGYAQPGTNGFSLLAATGNAGNATAIVNFERAYDAATGAIRSGFPSLRQGLGFLSSPIIVDVTGDGSAEVVDGGDSHAVMAFTATGSQAPAWPKFTTGWTILSPSAGDLDGDGDVELAASTREGWLFVWSTPGLSAANVEWWHTQHDEWHTGRYGTDTRPPGVVRSVSWTAGTTTLTFVAPGDDWYAGSVSSYRVTCVPSCGSITVSPSGPAGTTETVTVLPGTSGVMIQAVDDAGNEATPVLAKPD
jgi:hypothetical protein